MNLYETFLAVDVIEFDDSLLQIGLSKIEKQFINIASSLKITTNRHVYSDKELGNKPGFVIYLGIQAEGTKYERKVYDWIAYFGLVGGLTELLLIASKVLVHFLCADIILAKIV